jgi:hypothetical protein
MPIVIQLSLIPSYHGKMRPDETIVRIVGGVEGRGK